MGCNDPTTFGPTATETTVVMAPSGSWRRVISSGRLVPRRGPAVQVRRACRGLSLIIGTLLFLHAASGLAASTGTALVIGEGQYSGQPVLPRCSRAARAVSAGLRHLGFAVDEAIDAPGLPVREALNMFASRTAAAPDDPTMIYVCAEATTVGHRLFLLPSDVDPRHVQRPETDGVVMRALLNAMTGTKGSLVVELAMPGAGAAAPAVTDLRQTLPAGLHLALSVGNGKQAGALGERLASHGNEIGAGWGRLALALRGEPNSPPAGVTIYAPLPLSAIAPPAVAPPAPAPSEGSLPTSQAGTTSADGTAKQPLAPSLPSTAAPAMPPTARAAPDGSSTLASRTPPTTSASPPSSGTSKAGAASKAAEAAPTPPAGSAPPPAAASEPPASASAGPPSPASLVPPASTPSGPPPPAVAGADRNHVAAGSAPARISTYDRLPSPPASTFAPRNDRIRRLQVLLARHGIYRGEFNGRADDATTRAIRAYQYTLGDAMTGVMTQSEIVRLLNNR